MGKLQKFINLAYLIAFVLVFRWVSQESNSTLQYRHTLVSIVDRFLHNETLTSEDYPQQLVSKDITNLNGMESFAKIIQLGLGPIDTSSCGLSLNNRYQQMNAGDIITILAGENPNSQFLINLRNQYFKKRLDLIYGSDVEESQICIFINAEKQRSGEKVIKLMESIAHQEYQKYNVVYIDDASEGDSFSKARSFLYENYKDKLETQFVFQKNSESQGFIDNFLKFGKQHCSEKSIVLVLSAADFLINPQVLNMLNKYYATNQNTQVLSPKILTFPHYSIQNYQYPQIDLKNIRSNLMDPYLYSFKFSIVDKINEKSLMNPNTHKNFRKEGMTAFFYALMDRTDMSWIKKADDLMIGKYVERMSEEQEENIMKVRQIMGKVE